MSKEMKVVKHRFEYADKTPEEILAIARERGVELTDEQVDQISGGGWCTNYYAECFNCQSTFRIDDDAKDVYCPNCHTRIFLV